MRSLAVLLLIPIALGAQGRGGAGVGPLGGIVGGIPGQQQQQQLPPTPPADLCTVEGQVFDASTGQPLRKASITLNLAKALPGIAPTRTNFGATTDAGGKYTVTGVEPGQYRVNAQHTGFLSMQYNARRPSGPGTPLELARGQKMTGVDFRLTPHGVIAGHVVDEDGDPLQNVQLQLMRTIWTRGRKQMQQYNGSGTNDLGEYRMSGIVPGKYFLCAVYRGRNMYMDGMLPSPPGSQQQEDYVTTFYPGVTDIAAAVPLDMKPGQQLQGINLKLSKVHTVSIKGTVINNVAPPQQEVQLPGGGVRRIGMNVSLQLEPRNQLNPNGLSQGAAVRPDGSFEFPSIAPGPYTLVAMTNNGNQRHATTMPIDVGNSNMEGVTLTINPGVSVSGHIRIEGDTTDPIPTNFQVRLTVMTPGMNFGPPPQPAKADAENNFRFDDVNPDHFDVSVIPLPGNFYVKAIRSGNTDVINTGLDLTGGGGANLDVVIGVNAPQITGVVQNPTTQQPAIAATVVLIPQEKERHDSNVYYRTSNTDQSGNFTISRVPPGEYKIYAWEDVENGEWYDPEFLKPIEGKGTPVSVKEGNPVTVQVTMIPSGSVN